MGMRVARQNGFPVTALVVDSLQSMHARHTVIFASQESNAPVVLASARAVSMLRAVGTEAIVTPGHPAMSGVVIHCTHSSKKRLICEGVVSAAELETSDCQLMASATVRTAPRSKTDPRQRVRPRRVRSKAPPDECFERVSSGAGGIRTRSPQSRSNRLLRPFCAVAKKISAAGKVHRRCHPSVTPLARLR